MGNGIFLFMIHYMAYFLFVTGGGGGVPIWFGTTLSVASVISLNKTQFITHSRVFSLWSSFPFRCYPTALSTATDNPETLLFYFLIIVIFCPSVISLNKTQFITHSRVFSLWSSIPFRCFPTSFIIQPLLFTLQLFCCIFDNCNFLSYNF